MYLKRSSWILFQTLGNKLNYPLNDKHKQKYIYTRLNILDQKYCSEVHLQLCESFLEIGRKEHHWPVILLCTLNIVFIRLFIIIVIGTTSTDVKNS